MASRRYLTKSRFKLGMECPAKLFYTGKAGYANQSIDDSFLDALDEGGFQVGALAKQYFPDGHEIESLDYAEALAETAELLKHDSVVIYEAAIAVGNLFVRVDILVKSGNVIELYEVKAKSFKLGEDDFISSRGGIKAGWRPYLNDIAFQKHVVEKAFPEYRVNAHLVFADKNAVCPTDGLNQKFRVIKDEAGRKKVVVSESLSEDDLYLEMLCRLRVDDECDVVYQDQYEVGGNSFCFSGMVEYLAGQYKADIKIDAPVSGACSECEFVSGEGDLEAGLRSGFKECWKKQLGWSESDFECKTIFDVWNYRGKGKLLKQNRIKMDDIDCEDIAPKPDGRLGISASERHWLQVEKYQTRDNTAWIDYSGLRDVMSTWEYPLHFIDFETTMVALPFNAGRHPYEGVAFQFSHHVVYEDGKVEHFGEYINSERGVFPSYDFIRELKSQLENDSGSIFRYADHENSFLNIILKQLAEDKGDIPDREELCDFIRSITHSTNSVSKGWIGERDMIDMLDIVKRFYYDPRTNGSNSIKQVLPAMLNNSEYLQKKYSEPIYGSADGIKSLNFKDWCWIQSKNGEVIDPYKLLPKMFADITEKDYSLISGDDSVNNGGAALAAYGRMQFEEMSEYEREEIKSALLKYCELDTMAMVMIYEGWKDMIR